MLLGQHLHVTLQIIDGGHRPIRTDPNSILAADVHGMVYVGHDIVGGGVARLVEEGHEIDPDKATLGGHEAQLLVCLVPRDIDQGAAACVIDGDRLFGGACGIQADALTAVGEVNHDPVVIQLVDDFMTEGRQAAILGHHGAVPERVGSVVSQLNDTDTQPRENLHAGRIVTQHGGVLESVDETDLAFRLGAQDVRGRPDLQQVPAVGAHLGVGFRDVTHGRLEWIAVTEHISQCQIDGGEAGCMRLAHHTLVRWLGVGILQAAEGIHDDGIDQCRAGTAPPPPRTGQAARPDSDATVS